MAYRFGQFRRGQFSDYIKELDINDYDIRDQVTETEEFKGQKFYDVKIVKSFSPADGSLFLRFAVTRFTRETGVTIKLTKENTSALATNNTQTIAKITVPAAVTSEDLIVPLVYDIIITPNDNYGQLIFAIDRDGLDFTTTPRRWIGRHTFMVDSFGTIANIIPKLDIENMGRLKQIGVQAKPGLEMCVNGEMVRVGRSGIYELNHGIDITFLGFMPNEKDHFLMDYQY